MKKHTGPLHYFVEKQVKKHKTNTSIFNGKSTTPDFRGDLCCILEPLQEKKTQKSQLSF